MKNSNPWRAPLACVALALLFSSVGCHSLSTEPPKVATTMAGSWRVDPAASDDFDAKLATVLQQARRHDQPRPGMSTEPPPGAARTQIQPLLVPFEEPEKMRTRLAEDLRPANGLRIAFIGDGLEITRDSEPTRQFLPAQSVSRIDTSGAFNVSCGWDQGAFVIRAKYTNHGARSWKIEHDIATDSLRVTFTANNPQYGHLELHTLYRRTTEGAS